MPLDTGGIATGNGRTLAGSFVLTIPASTAVEEVPDFSIPGSPNFPAYVATQASTAQASAIGTSTPAWASPGVASITPSFGGLFAFGGGTNFAIPNSLGFIKNGANGQFASIFYASTVFPVSSGGTSINTGNLIGVTEATVSYSISTLYYSSVGVGINGGFTELNFFPAQFEPQMPVQFCTGTYEVLAAGQIWTISIQTSAGTVSQSGTISAADAAAYILDPTEDYWCSMGAASATANTAPIPASVTGTFMGAPMGKAALENYNFGGGYQTAVDYTNGVSASTTGGLQQFIIAGGVETEFTALGGAGAMASYQAPMIYSLAGQIDAMDQPHSSSFACELLTSDGTATSVFRTVSAGFNANPAISGTVKMPGHAFGVIVTTGDSGTGDFGLNPPIYPIVAAFGSPYLFGVSAAILPTSLTNETASDGAIPVRCEPFNALTVGWTNNSTVDALNTPSTWWTGGGTHSPAGYPNVTQVSAGVLQFDETQDFAGNPPTQTWVLATYSPAINISGARYLQFQIQAIGGSGTINCSVQITDSAVPGQPDKLFNFTLTGAGGWQTITIDLCSPDSGGSAGQTYAAVQQDTELTGFNFSGLNLVAAGNPWMMNSWGVELLQKLRLNLPASGQQYQIRNLVLTANNGPRWSLLSEVGEVRDAVLPTGTKWPPIMPLRVGTVDVDGRRGLELVGNIPNAQGVLQPKRFSDVATQINAVLGFTASVPTGDQSKWQYSSYASTLGGNGIIFPPNPSAQSWIDNPFNSGTIQGQVQAPALIVPPMCGDILNGGSTGPTILYLHKKLRGRATGLTLNSSGKPVTNANVTLTDTASAANYGTAVSDSEARYLTGKPFAKDGRSITLTSGSNTVAFTVSDRLVRRICPEGTTGAEKWPYHIYEKLGKGFGRLWVVSIDITGNVHVRRSDSDNPVWAVDQPVTTTNDCYRPRIWISPYTARANIIFVRQTLSGGGAVIENDTWTTWSDDDGQTWAAPTLLMSNLSVPFGFTGKEEYGAEVRGGIVYDSGTSGPSTIQAQYRDPGSTSWTTLTTLLDDSGNPLHVADQGMGNGYMRQREDGCWTLVFVAVGDTTPSTWVSGDDFTTFKKFT